MADITAAERKAIAESIASALAVEAEPKAAAPALPAAAAANPKQFFCQNWPLVKQALQVAQTFVGPVIRGAIAIVITAGDGISKAICK